MEKKTTQRIIGILVIAALVIILLPLLFSGQEAATETAALNPPPFPGSQANQDETNIAQNDSQMPNAAAPTNAATSNPAETQNPTDVNMQANSGTLTPPTANQDQSAQNNTTNTDTQPGAHATQNNGAQGSPTSDFTDQPAVAAQPTANTQPDNIQDNAPQPAAKEPAPVNALTSQTTEIVQQQSATAPSEDTKYDPESFDIPGDAQGDALPNKAPAPTGIATTVVTPPTQAPTPQYQSNIVPVANAPAVDTPLVKTHNHTTPAKRNMTQFTNAAWVVQMGSFKTKANAVHLANRLRAMGYKAFMQQSKSAQGEARTHVYVGPEFKKVAASSLLNKIDHDTSIHGFVVSYKPLEL